MVLHIALQLSKKLEVPVHLNDEDWTFSFETDKYLFVFDPELYFNHIHPLHETDKYPSIGSYFDGKLDPEPTVAGDSRVALRIVDSILQTVIDYENRHHY